MTRSVRRLSDAGRSVLNCQKGQDVSHAPSQAMFISTNIINYYFFLLRSPGKTAAFLVDSRRPTRKLENTSAEARLH